MSFLSCFLANKILIWNRWRVEITPRRCFQVFTICHENQNYFEDNYLPASKKSSILHITHTWQKSFSREASSKFPVANKIGSTV